IKHVAPQSEIFGQENRIFDFVSGHEDLVKHALLVHVLAEWVERCIRIGIEQSNAQGVVVHDTAEADEALAFIVTETELPFPSFELVPSIGKFAQIAFQATSKIIVVCVDFKGQQTNFQGTVTNTSCELRA